MTENTHLYTLNLVAFTMKAFLIFIEMRIADFRIFYKSLATMQTHVLTGKRSEKTSQHNIERV